MDYHIWRCDNHAPCEECQKLADRCWEAGADHPWPPLHPYCQCVIEISDTPEGIKGLDTMPTPHARTQFIHGLWSEPYRPELRILDATGNHQPLDPDARRALRARLASGELNEIVFEARTFRATYPNHNFVRFNDDDLPAFAASFVDQPFLRDHNGREIAARAGIVRASTYDAATRALIQQIAITVPRDMHAFIDGQMDRFSVSWHWTEPLCTVCGQTWLSRDCRHWPGINYPAGADKPAILCELLFLEPRAREVSAVNIPAVSGTGIEQMLSALCSAKQTLLEDHVTLATPAPNQAPEAPGLANGTLPAAEMAAFVAATRETVLDARLKTTNLPTELQEHIRSGLRSDWTITELDRAIESARSMWAKLEADRTIQGIGTPRDGRATGMLTSLDRVSEAMTALIEGRPTARGVRPLTSLREAYILLTGDWDMHGMFHADRTELAVDTSTMAGIVANAMNKVVANEFQKYPQWWKPIMHVENFTTLQQIKWITLGGFGELPEVPEGGAYDELTWDDQTETSEWSKRGGYVGITLEAMDRDDVSKLRSAPRAMAQAGWLSLGKAISRIFTINSGTGKTMSDGKALFHTDHGNLGTTACSAAAIAAVKTAMRKQTEVNSGERLGALTTPKFLLTPSDIEATALTALASENMPGTANNDANPQAAGNTHDARMDAARRRLVVMDLWTDANDWAMVADPDLYPALGLGFRFGEMPEIFSVASPGQTSGLMFTNDQLPVKVRFFFATGPMDWRGVYKMNVA